MADSAGLGNLADELGEALDEDGEGNTDEHGGEVYGNGVANGHPAEPTLEYKAAVSRERSLSPPKHSMRSNKKHQRQDSHYDRSDYGDDSDLDCVDGISSGLEARMAAVENLSRRGTEANGSELDGVVLRLVDHLKELGSQSSIENGTSRLITTHTALTSHLSNQTRSLSTLTHHILSPLSAGLDPSSIDDIIPLLSALLLDLPTPISQPLSSLHSLHASTTDIISIFTYLSDTLQMTRQTTSLASRRLRSATEMVVEMRREAEAGEEAVRWIEKGDWEKRLAGRECAGICRDVLGGFEDTCSRWRERLVVGLEVGA